MRVTPLLTLSLIVLCLLNISPSKAQGWQWAKRAGGTNNEVFSYVATDKAGNVYTSGAFQSSTLVFGSTTLTNVGVNDVYVARYDAIGAVLWARSAGGPGEDFVEAITTDPSGNIYIVGRFEGPSVTFGAYTLTHTGTGSNIFVVKYDASGTVLWAKQAGTGSYYNEAISVATDPAGYVYVAGYFEEPTILFGTVALTSSGGSDLFLVKYSPTGSVVWARNAVGINNDRATAVTTDNFGHVCITGFFAPPSIKFGTTILPNSGAFNVFVVQYDTAGTVKWANGTTGSFFDGGYSIATDLTGNVFVTGSFSSPTMAVGATLLTNTSSGTDDLFLLKYSSTGTLSWAKSIGGTSVERGNCVITDDTGNAYLAGYFASSSLTFGSSTITNSGAVGSTDMFLAKFTAAGAAKWALSSGASSTEFAYSMAANPSSSIYVAGTFHSPSVSFGTTTLTSAGLTDVYLAKYNQAPAPLPIAGPTKVCQGQAITLTDAVTGGAWTSGSTTIATVGTSSGSVYGVSPGTATISYISPGGSVTTTVTVLPLPATTATSNSPVCAGDTLKLSDIGATGSVTYLWSTSGGYSSTLAAPSIPGVTTAMAGTYLVMVTSTVTGCSNGSTTVVVIDPLPSTYVTGGSGVYILSGTVTLSGSDAGTSYQLYDAIGVVGTAVIGTGTTLGFPVSATGTYYIVATSAAGCSDTMSGTAAITIESVSGVSSLAGGQIIFSPNPVKDILGITAPLIEKVQITGVTGNIVLDEHYAGPSVTIDLSRLSPGLYLVRVNDQYVHKVIKE